MDSGPTDGALSGSHFGKPLVSVCPAEGERGPT